MKIETGRPAPKIRVPVKRVTDELAGLLPGQSVEIDPLTVNALRSFGKKRGWVMATKFQRNTGLIGFWRVA